MKLNQFGWDKKPRTVLRSIKIGDIFAMQTGAGTYAFGRIMTKVLLGHVGEVFDLIAAEPVLTAEALTHAHRIGKPVVLDSYTLFDKKLAGDWRIIAHQEGYEPSDYHDVFFTSGIANSCKKVDIFGVETPISQTEAAKLPDFSPMEDWDIKEILAPYLK